MDREAIQILLHNNKQQLQDIGVRSLAIFGSFARDEARPDSDVDFLVELEPPLTFNHYIHLKFYLKDLLEQPVDLVMPEALKPRVRASAEQEAIFVT